MYQRLPFRPRCMSLCSAVHWYQNKPILTQTMQEEVTPQLKEFVTLPLIAEPSFIFQVTS